MDELTPDIGKLELRAIEWGTHEDGEYYYTEDLVETHMCTEEELGLTGESSDFYPVIDGAGEELEYMVGRFRCLDREDMHINGHYNADNARMLYIFLKRCINEDDDDHHRRVLKGDKEEKIVCADDETIKNYFAGSYIDLMSNRIRFDYRMFGEESLIKESTLVWTAVQTQIQTEMPFKITRTEVQLQDMAVNFDDLTELLDDGVFKLELQQPRPYERFKDTVMAVSFEVNPDLPVLTRNNYTILDVCSDVGGLAEVVYRLIGLILAMLNYQHL